MIKPIKIKNKKAQISFFDVFVFMITAIVVILFFALFKFGFGILTNVITNVQTPSNAVGLNISLAGQQTFGQVNNALNGLHTLAFIIIFGMLLSVLLHNFLVKVHPAFFILYVLIAIIAIVTSFYISNTYQTLLAVPVIGAAIAEFTASTFIMINLPVWVAVVSLLGGAFLVMNIINNRNQGGFR